MAAAQTPHQVPYFAPEPAVGKFSLALSSHSPLTRSKPSEENISSLEKTSGILIHRWENFDSRPRHVTEGNVRTVRTSLPPRTTWKICWRWPSPLCTDCTKRPRGGLGCFASGIIQEAHPTTGLRCPVRHIECDAPHRRCQLYGWPPVDPGCGATRATLRSKRLANRVGSLASPGRIHLWPRLVSCVPSMFLSLRV